MASAVDAPGGPAHSVDVLLRRQQTSCLRSRSGRLALVSVWGVHRLFGYLGVVRGVVLDDPVHLGDVQSSGGHVRAQQDPRVGVAELEEGGGALGLLLLALQAREEGVPL